ncbi:uncharacterized protein TRIVIDRAFT_191968 [Trichoderma virens Gv29-8]|uniref:Uncharacterized protein n=1 Tax=Hypocrea virens (strain Gv29-8 / FGSC 10586) TaxID=413071 RepID=G9MV11_HYPVG|nr:uncharacterized protein TRIVIDRAFT_191968 [Trichoderma virens Gv29-8]EHK21735.1 hypothetical protein TRIVIDRAFT_191968 [Trichoderma virens Gv29-8]
MLLLSSVFIRILVVVGAFASPLIDNRDKTDDNNPNANIFPPFEEYEGWAICQGKITKDRFPNLQAPEKKLKHTFMVNQNSGKRSCALYSSPNLPTGVTLQYNLAKIGALAPLTFLDAANTKPDIFSVSGFIVQDQNKAQYC